MQHIAIITSGLVGITNASFKLVSKLKAEGFTVTYLSTKDIKEKVEGQGFNYIQLPEINFGFSFLNSKPNKKNLGKLKKYLYHFTHLKSQYSNGIKQLNFDTYEKVLRELKPDLAIIDQELHEITFSAIKLDISVKILSPHFSNVFRYNLPPIRTDIIPNIGFKGSTVGILMAWLYIKLKIWARLWINKITLKDSRRSILKRYAKSIGFSTKHLISRNFPSVYIHKHLPVLSMTMLELEFPHIIPKNFTYVGAIVFNNIGDNKKHSEITNKIDTIINHNKKNHNKLIYCSLTTMKETGDLTFIKNVINALKDEPKWTLIISLGGKLSPNEFKKLPENVHIFKWVPQLKVLKESDCSINHGGIHTINECMFFKVPMLVYSGKKFDQNGCAARIAYHGLGLMGDKDLDNSEIIHSKIDKILNADSFKKKLKKVHDIYENYESRIISSYL